MKMKNKKILAAMVAAAVVSAAPAMAQSCNCNADDGSTVVNLSADARRTVSQDRIGVSLQIEKTAKTPAEAQNFINAKMQEARVVYGKASAVKVSTGNYNVYKQYSNEPAPKRDGTPAWTPEEREKNAYWQAQQQLRLDGADKEAVMNLVASLQKQGFAVQNMNFYLSREASDKLRDELTAEALGTIKTRAENMARTLNMKSIRYARIDTSGGAVPPMPMARAYAMQAEKGMAGDAMSTPVAQAGESDVELTVSAEVRLK